MTKKKENIYQFLKRKVKMITKKITLPGFDGESVFDVFTFLFKELRRDSINVRAAAVAFNFLMSLFPTIIVLFTLIPYIHIKGFQDTLMSSIQNIMPNDAYSVINTTIQDIVRQHHGKLLSIGILLATFYSTRGVFGLMNSFDKAYPSFRKRRFYSQIWVSIKITLLLFLLLMLSIILILAGESVIRFIMHILHITRHSTYLVLNSLKWLIIIFLFYISISLIYFYGPAVHTRWRFFSAGSTLAAFLSMLTSLAFSYFINNFGQYNKIYGSIGTLIVIMLWLYYNSLILLIGFELNASIDVNKHNKSLKHT